MTYGDFDKLARTTAPGKLLCDKVFDFTNNLQYDRYLRDLTSLVYKSFDKKFSGSGGAICVMQLIQLLAHLNKNQLIKNCRNVKYAHFL